MNNELIQFGESRKTMSSLEIAEATGKQHKDVLKAIRNMEPSWEKVAGRKFALSNYKDSTGRELPCYELTKRECLYVATKFNDEARAKLVIRWEALEKGEAQPAALQPKSGAEMLLMYAQQMVEQERKLNVIQTQQLALESRISNIEQRTTTSLPYTTIVGYANRFGIRCPREKACALGKVATNLCKQYNFEMGRVEDPRFGTVKTYPDGVLRETFERYYPDTDFSSWH